MALSYALLWGLAPFPEVVNLGNLATYFCLKLIFTIIFIITFGASEYLIGL